MNSERYGFLATLVKGGAMVTKTESANRSVCASPSGPLRGIHCTLKSVAPSRAP
ncbi:hypothetical protein M407DRAFT_241476 [Tulasnella calospora MUT 4182]|uniref:Uncharacterized protein n=1 Tax=Tulasnella calospora MUT 4182 TaxID=1051891 RepID=A0A0C3QJG7_9AGAM|nr:hypothetical protein M407DRAFT_241476 [Tulasnella calospora MUT 4182]